MADGGRGDLSACLSVLLGVVGRGYVSEGTKDAVMGEGWELVMARMDSIVWESMRLCA